MSLVVTLRTWPARLLGAVSCWKLLTKQIARREGRGAATRRECEIAGTARDAATPQAAIIKW